ncbi:MAG: DNA (cytosine-5-)-methyltransferase [Candidatus Woesearchaeota archaeon]
MFTGYGGAEFALQNSNINYEIIGYSEIDKYACKIYEKNFGKITNYGNSQKINPNEIPNFDLLTGGFPCQSFSITGNRRGELDPRGTLIYDIIRIVKVKQPKWIVLENVKGFATKNFKHTFNKIIREFQKIGYKVKWDILNTKNYGIPQHRERIIFVMYRKDLKMNFQFPEPEPLNIYLQDVLDKEVDEKYYLNEEQIQKFEQFINYNNNLNQCIQVGKINNNDNSDRINRVYSSKGISFSITASYMPKLVLQKKIRKLTPTECFRLQGFLNDEINLSDISDSQLYKLAGNGWSINVFQRIFENMFYNNINNTKIKRLDKYGFK